jgi:predicted alpha/beta hydrolase family esterase
MIYGYNSLSSSHGTNKIIDYGRELMEELKKVRSTEEVSDTMAYTTSFANYPNTALQARQRPLYFVAHGFGGIILAHVSPDNRPLQYSYSLE